MAVDVGADLSSDSDLSFTTDIDEHLRTDWDIGADEASIEFDPTVMESGGDYSTLALWEAGMQTDLTADTTRVFSHGGITGAIADTDSVTGVTSSATADVVHASSTEILLENITGTFQDAEQIQVDGSNHVTSSNAGNPAHAVAKIDGVWTGAETSQFTITGWETGPNNYIRIYTTSAARHDGTWSTNKYRLVPTGAGINVVLLNYETYIRIEGLQIENAATTGWTADGINVADTVLGAEISDNVIRYTGSNNVGYRGIAISDAQSNNTKIFNNIIYNFERGINTSGLNYTGAFVYNNTIYNARNHGISSGYYKTIAKNNITQNCGDGFDGSDWPAGNGYNIVDDSVEGGAFGDTYSSGTTTGTTAGKLVDSGATFQPLISIPGPSRVSALVQVPSIFAAAIAGLPALEEVT